MTHSFFFFFFFFFVFCKINYETTEVTFDEQHTSIGERDGPIHQDVPHASTAPIRLCEAKLMGLSSFFFFFFFFFYKNRKTLDKKKNEDDRYIAVVIWSWFTNGNVHDAVYMVVLNAYYVTSDEYFSRRSDLVLVGILAFPFLKGQ